MLVLRKANNVLFSYNQLMTNAFIDVKQTHTKCRSTFLHSNGRTSPSSHTDAPCTSSRTVVYTTKVDKCVMSDVEMTDDIELEID